MQPAGGVNQIFPLKLVTLLVHRNRTLLRHLIVICENDSDASRTARRVENCRGESRSIAAAVIAVAACSKHFVHADGGADEDVSLRPTVAGGRRPCDTDTGRLKTVAMVPLLLTCLLVSVGSRAPAVYVLDSAIYCNILQYYAVIHILYYTYYNVM